MGKTLDNIMRDATAEYLQTIDTNNPPTPADLTDALITHTRAAIDLENTVRSKEDKIKTKPETLSHAQIADVLLALYHVRTINMAGRNTDKDHDILGIYQESGVNQGIYISDLDTIRNIVRQYKYNITDKEFSEVIKVLHSSAQRAECCHEPDLIAVNNGIFDYKTKTLMPFTPDHVFTVKSRVNYEPHPINPIIHNPTDNTDWDVESWMHELSEDDSVVELLWQILGAIIRPHVRWNKTAWFYSTVGNNGKGTLCELMRNICGDGSYAVIPIANFGKDFLLEPLMRASAIIVDENDVGTYIDKAANLKAVITNDVIQINRKFKTPVAYRFYGFMVQCLNEFPRVKDKSGSFYRRQIFVPFEKCFTGQERKYIKSDYLKRPDVLEYVLHKVLHMNYYSLLEPAVCRATMEEYMEFNDPVRQFLSEIMPQLQWPFIPEPFLYDLYNAWYARNVSTKNDNIGKTRFYQEVEQRLQDDSNWKFTGKQSKTRVPKKCESPEPLILQYGLTNWMNPHYTGNNASMRCSPQVDLLPRCDGFWRVSAGNITDDDSDD